MLPSVSQHSHWKKKTADIREKEQCTAAEQISNKTTEQTLHKIQDIRGGAEHVDTDSLMT